MTPFRTAKHGTRLPLLAVATILAAVAGACGPDDGTGPDGLRFGQIGEARLHLETSLFFDQGKLEQTVDWSSRGPVRLEEAISYEGVQGDRTVTVRETNPTVLAGEYAIWIAQINEAAGLQLFVPQLDPSLEPECVGELRTRLTLRIRDEVRQEEVAWTRCVNGSLGFLSTRAGPDAAAARVASAAILLRNSTFPEGFASVYDASVPFATVARGEDSRMGRPEPRAITSDTEWELFWQDHTDGASGPPAVDFAKDLVLVGAVGVREEAGDSVEIRRVLPVADRTIVQLVERVPGNFCSPAARTHVPFHIVRAPRMPLPLPVEFGEPSVETVPCGL